MPEFDCKTNRTNSGRFAVPATVLALIFVLLTVAACYFNRRISMEWVSELNSHQGVSTRAKNLAAASSISTGLMFASTVWPAFFLLLVPVLTPRNAAISIIWCSLIAIALWLGNSIPSDLDMAMVHQQQFAFVIPGLFFGLLFVPILVNRWMPLRLHYSQGPHAKLRNERNAALAGVAFCGISLVIISTTSHTFRFSMFATMLIAGCVVGAALTLGYRMLLASRNFLAWWIVITIAFSIVCFLGTSAIDDYPGVAEYNSVALGVFVLSALAPASLARLGGFKTVEIVR